MRYAMFVSFCASLVWLISLPSVCK